jgi:hypothetical protein
MAAAGKNGGSHPGQVSDPFEAEVEEVEEEAQGQLAYEGRTIQDLYQQTRSGSTVSRSWYSRLFGEVEAVPIVAGTEVLESAGRSFEDHDAGYC